MYDELGHWLGEYDSSGGAIQQFLWMEDVPVGLIATGGQLNYIESDHLGTPRVVIEDATNLTVWKWDITGEAFGKSGPNQDPDGNSIQFVLNMRFPGQIYDPDTGLTQNGRRMYEAATGRYASSDPIGLNGGLTTYSYVSGRPLQAIDPFGLAWIEYTGATATLYDGDQGDRSKQLNRCWAASGRNDPGKYDYRNSQAQHIKGWGPIPEGIYWINLVPDPNRMARFASNGELSPGIGIEKIPSIGSYAWGTLRARLEKRPDAKTERDNFYIHDSKKKATQGCIETCSEMIKNLIELRATGVKGIEVLVDYPNGRATWTYGP